MKSNKNDSKIRVNLNNSTSEVPDVTDDEVRGIQKVLREHEVTLSSLAPGLFRIPLDYNFVS